MHYATVRTLVVTWTSADGTNAPNLAKWSVSMVGDFDASSTMVEIELKTQHRKGPAGETRQSRGLPVDMRLCCRLLLPHHCKSTHTLFGSKHSASVQLLELPLQAVSH